MVMSLILHVVWEKDNLLFQMLVLHLLQNFRNIHLGFDTGQNTPVVDMFAHRVGKMVPIQNLSSVSIQKNVLLRRCLHRQTCRFLALWARRCSWHMPSAHPRLQKTTASIFSLTGGVIWSPLAKIMADKRLGTREHEEHKRSITKQNVSQTNSPQ